MIKRIASPDTPADVTLRACLDQKPTRSFVMVAGAGSGKTTSLVKALAHLEEVKGPIMRKHGQQVACITFTEIAVGEVRSDVGNTKLFHVSTIHSFLWTLVHSFQEDIRAWVATRIEEKINEARERLDNPRTRANTRIKLNEDIARYNLQLGRLPHISRFTYGPGGDYAQGVLGHEDIMRLGPTLIEQFPLMQSVVAQRFPYIFVDESQDTDPDVVAALKRVAEAPDITFCIGFFGDPMQKIYLAGAGAIAQEVGWNEPITKPENFRCPLRVIDVINAVRAEDDGLEQIAAPRIGSEGPIPTPEGTAKLFIAPTTGDRTACLNETRQLMAQITGDALWAEDRPDKIKVLVLVHRSAARRLGFPDLYAALNDNESTSLKEGLLEGTAWVLRPFMDYLLPLIAALRIGSDFEVMSLLRKYSPLLAKDRLVGQDVSAILAQLQTDVNTLDQMLNVSSTSTIRDVLSFVYEKQLAQVDERFLTYLEDVKAIVAAEAVASADDSGDEGAVTAYLAVPATQLWGYRTYVQDQSPFSTQQGIKGAEFGRVLVILDDEESQYRQFSYGKYWGIEPLSVTDQQHIANHEDSVIARTRRLFYVCCSRALQDLAVVFFVPNVVAAQAAIAAKGIFRPEDVHVLNT